MSKEFFEYLVIENPDFFVQLPIYEVDFTKLDNETITREVDEDSDEFK